jgi:bacterioferritin (cytochrome b1)
MTTTSKDQELIEILNSQIEVEKSTLKEIDELEETVTEPNVRLVLMSMHLDTWKHQKFLEGVVKIINKIPCDLWSEKVQRYVDRIKFERKVNALMDREASMIDYLGKAINLMSDPIGIMLLEHLRNDEERQNENLKKLIRIIQQAPLQPKKGVKGSDIECKE